MDPPEWPTTDNGAQLGESYRRCCTSVSWVGEALVIHLLHAEGVCNHPAFFDYVDRWMNEDDAMAVAKIRQQTGRDYSGKAGRHDRQSIGLRGEARNPSFIDDMWKAYASKPQAKPRKTVGTADSLRSSLTRTERSRPREPTCAAAPSLRNERRRLIGRSTFSAAAGH